jgi:hypothetical protein
MSTVETLTEDRRHEAIERLKKRSEFWTHLAAYLLVNATIVIVWFMTTPGGFFWPVFPLAGWGIGLFFHGMETFRRPFSEEQIHREMARLPRQY